MQLEQTIYWVVFLLFAPALYYGGMALWEGIVFYRYVRRLLAEAPSLRGPSGNFLYQPRTAVILPCCGVDEKLRQTVEALGRQNFENYEVVFTFESDRDPAYAPIVDWTRSWESLRKQFVIAGPTTHRAQKVHNLLAAVQAVTPDREALVFLDSDAIPGPNWLGQLLAPLQDDRVGATTGYRWYVATGGWVEGVRGAWNAATVSILADKKLSFCWGGSTAIRRDRFDSLGVARRWENAITDDYPLTHAVRDGGLEIRFVPQAMVPSSDRTTWRGFWNFAKRQVAITRVYNSSVWRSAFVLCMSFMIGGTAVAGLFFCGLFGWFGSQTAMYWGFAGWMFLLALALAMTVIREMAMRLVLHPPDWTWRDFIWDVFGTLTFGCTLHFSLLVASINARRFFWRHIEYEMVSIHETRILQRKA